MSWLSDLLNSATASLLLQALMLTATAIGAVIGFILIRRAWRSRVLGRRDRRALEIRGQWSDIISGRIPASMWWDDRLSREIIETRLLDQLESADGDAADALRQCAEASGLLDHRLQEARSSRGFRRRRALIALGRMRSAEAIPVLAEALQDQKANNVLAAVRGLGRVERPDAAVPLLEHLIASGARLPVLPVQHALVACCRTRPEVLVPYIRRAEPEVRRLLARVLGEVASGALAEDLLLLASDPQPEVRASAARALNHAPAGLALTMLASLAQDAEWFVRLRAIVSLGTLRLPAAVPILVQAACDENRFVRLRAAMGLAALTDQAEQVIDLVEQQQDLYAMQALLSQLEVSGAILAQVDRLGRSDETAEQAERILLRVLRLGSHRLLVSLLVSHRDALVRSRLAALLARSAQVAALPLLERALAAEPSADRADAIVEVITALRSVASEVEEPSAAAAPIAVAATARAS